jgi:hypothetical protein
MGHWWNYPNLGLSEWEIDSLDANKAAFFVVPGDYNQNGTVDAADYVLYRNNLGSGTSLPNDDTPGVGPDDYVRWRANFGKTAGSGAALGLFSKVSVPEPPTVVMFMLAMMVSLLGNAPRCHKLINQ